MKFKYTILALALIGALVLWKFINWVIPAIIGCLILYVVYIVHTKLKRAKSRACSTKQKGEVK
jgi:predicted PurR-regulated permease PerM